MTRAAAALAAAFAALALVASGCGSKSSGGNGLDTALRYVPKVAPLVVAIDTNPDGAQWKQVNELLGKFPFGGQVKQQVKNAFNARANVDYDRDIKPLLGSEMVVAVTGPSANGHTPYVFAWKLKDEAAARRLLQATAPPYGSVSGTEVYGSPPTDFALIKDGTLVIADTKASLEAALNRAGGDHMTQGDFNAALGDLKSDSLVRAAGNFPALLAGPKAAEARRVKWLSALRTFGVTVRAESDGIAWAFDAKTDSAGLTESGLPLASGAESPPVVERPGEIGFAVRNPAQIVSFGEQVAQITNPQGYGKFLADKAKLSRQLGVSVDRDLIGQLTGNATMSAGIDGSITFRSELRDPAAATKTLKTIAPRISTIARSNGKTVTVAQPSNGKGFYTVTNQKGKKTVLGIVGNSLVVGNDAARAAQFASAPASPVSGAKGSLVIASDARALANAVAAKQGQGVAAQIVTSALGDLVGSVETDMSGMHGSLKLQIK